MKFAQIIANFPKHKIGRSKCTVMCSFGVIIVEVSRFLPIDRREESTKVCIKGGFEYKYNEWAPKLFDEIGSEISLVLYRWANHSL